MKRDFIESLSEFKRKMAEGMNDSRIEYNIKKMIRRYSVAQVVRYIARYPEFDVIWSERCSYHRMIASHLATLRRQIGILSKRCTGHVAEDILSLQSELAEITPCDRWLICHLCTQILYVETVRSGSR